MKKILLFIAIIAISLNISAQEQMYIWQNGTKTTFAIAEVDSITHDKNLNNGHEYVDLGLPSGLLWATCNVGASKPEEYGDYFAWGETTTKSIYEWYTYIWCDSASISTLTKYNTDINSGIVDNKIVLDDTDDAAVVNWGGTWRIPTYTEMEELVNNCTWIWTIQNGVSGYLITSNISGYTNKSIFLPANGVYGSNLRNENSFGYYWLNSIWTGNPNTAYILSFGSTYESIISSLRYFGHSIRPVCIQNTSASKQMHVWRKGVATSFVIADVDSVTFTTEEETPPAIGTENGYEWVDLGLSVMWATCNVGASKPEDYGDYFAWGEVESKEYYDWSNYKWCNGSDSTLTKYNNKSSNNGVVDNKTQLELSDDAAHARWGGNWRMPTKEEQDELLEKCTWTWTTKRRVNGYNVIGPNGNSIFLPAAGQYYYSTFAYSNSMGYYWTSSLEPDRLGCAQNWLFNSGIVTFGSGYRFVGNSVRPVIDINSGSMPDNPDNPNDTDDPVVTTGIAIKAKVPAHWTDQITVWVWPTGGEGKEYIPLKEGDWYVYTHTAESELNIIFKNGFGWNGAQYQTVDITGITQNTCITIEQEGWEKATYTIVDCLSGEPNQPEQPESPTIGVENGYKWVDLGLSVKWATCNVGANAAEEYGNYFAWGEVEPKDYYDWSTYKYCNGSDTTLTKYCTNGTYGTIDHKTVLDKTDDAATVNWGGNWRMPTKEEYDELLGDCTWTWTMWNGVYGHTVTGPNGKSIFLPATGYCNENLFYEVGGRGEYWLSSVCTDYPCSAWYGHFISNSMGGGYTIRHYGRSVRPVCP